MYLYCIKTFLSLIQLALLTRGCFLAFHKVNAVYSEKIRRYSTVVYVLYFTVIYFLDSCNCHSKFNLANLTMSLNFTLFEKFLHIPLEVTSRSKKKKRTPEVETLSVCLSARPTLCLRLFVCLSVCATASGSVIKSYLDC